MWSIRRTLTNEHDVKLNPKSSSGFMKICNELHQTLVALGSTCNLDLAYILGRNEWLTWKNALLKTHKVEDMTLAHISLQRS
jgi:hypothetical protein